jgi:hypothetical protein
MSGWSESAVDIVARRQSRRGLFARLAKVALGIGVAMAGVSVGARKAYAQCCGGTDCTTLVHTGCVSGCPQGCSQVGQPSQCCDTATGYWHDCYPCDCAGQPCTCEYDTVNPCP